MVEWFHFNLSDSDIFQELRGLATIYYLKYNIMLSILNVSTK